MNTTPYFTNPDAMRVLGKRLFKLAVHLSRLDDRSKARVEQSIRAVKGRKLIYFKRAVHEVTQLRDDMIIARRDRIYRKAGRTPVELFYTAWHEGRPIMARIIRTHKGPFRPAYQPRPLMERLHEYKKSKSDRVEYEHLSALGQHFDRAYRPHHHVEFTFTDDPSAVCFEGRSKHKPHEYCRIWTQTQSHWNVVLPRDWWDRVRPLHEKIASAYLSLGVLDYQHLPKPRPAEYDGTYPRYLHCIEEHYAVRIAKQRRGFRITTDNGFIVRRTISEYRLYDGLDSELHVIEDIYRYGQTIKEASAAVDRADPILRRRKQERLDARRQQRAQQLQEAIETLKLVQSGHRSVHNLTEREKLDLLRVVQDQIANAQKRTATFGGIGQRAIAEPTCAAA